VKTCNICGETKAFSEFHKRKQSKDGHQSSCKVCRNEYNAKWLQDNKKHAKEYKSKWYQENKEYMKELNAKWRQENKEYNTKWRQDNKEYVKEYYVKYAKANKGAVNAYKAKRRAAKLQATPAWADQEKIKEIYNRASRANSFCEKYSLNTRFHVDHIVPLQGNEVSGLHVADNLQVITAEENLKKSNNYEVG